MKIKTTLWLAITVMFLVSVLYVLDHRSAPPEMVLGHTRVFDITTEPITLLGLERNGERIEAVYRDGQWFLQSPVRARASHLLLQQLAATAERLRSLDTITVEQRALRNLTLSDYGLDPAAGVFYLEAGGRRETLRVGSRIPFGGGVYGYRPETDAVIVLSEDVLSLLAPTQDDLRDRALFSGSQRRVTRVDLHRREVGFLQLIRRGGSWFVQQPLEWPADPGMVQQLLDALYVLQVQRFVWDAPADTNDDLQSPAFRSQVEEASLAPDQARARITVWVEGSNTGEELFLGSMDAMTPGQLYARRGGVPSVFTVPEMLGEIAARQVDHFRDRRVLPSRWEDVTYFGLVHGDRRLQLARGEGGDWQMVAPIRSPVRDDAVQQVFRSLAALRIASFAPVALPASVGEALRVVAGLPDQSPEERAANAVELFPVDAGDSEVQWLGRLGADGDVLRMTGFEPENGFTGWLDPERYRRRTIFALAANALTRIQRTSVHGDVVLVRQEENGNWQDWQLLESAGRALDSDALRLLLAVLLPLQAESVVAFEPASLVPFGLHAPVMTLTLRFADAARLRQSLLLGIGPEDGSTYALLQGHGFVFRLQADDAEALLADLLLPVPTEQDAAEGTLDAPPPAPPVEDGEEGAVPVLPLLDAEDPS